MSILKAVDSASLESIEAARRSAAQISYMSTDLVMLAYKEEDGWQFFRTYKRRVL